MNNPLCSAAITVVHPYPLVPVPPGLHPLPPVLGVTRHPNGEASTCVTSHSRRWRSRGRRAKAGRRRPETACPEAAGSPSPEATSTERRRRLRRLLLSERRRAERRGWRGGLRAKGWSCPRSCAERRGRVRRHPEGRRGRGGGAPEREHAARWCRWRCGRLRAEAAKAAR